MGLDNYLTYLVVAFFTITTPGAAILLSVSNAMMFDLKAVFLSTTGNVLGLFILSLVAMLIVGSILRNFNGALSALRLIGALYLIYLGVKQIRHRQIKLVLKQNSLHNSSYKPARVFLKGFLVAVTNPKPLLFFSAVLPLFIKKDYNITTQFFILTGTFMAISFCSLMFYGFMSQKLKMWFFDKKGLSVFYKVSGALFIFMGMGMLFL